MSDSMERVEAGVEAMDELKAKKLAEFKQKKKEAAERFKEARAKEKAERIEGAKKLIATLKDNGLWDELEEEHHTFLNSLVAAGNSQNAGGMSFFTKMFGADAKVGTSVTLREAFERTLKGQNNIDFYVSKKWPEKGIIVKVEKNDENVLETTYTIESLGE